MTTNAVFDLPGAVPSEQGKQTSAHQRKSSFFLHADIVHLERALVDALAKQQSSFMEDIVALLKSEGTPTVRETNAFHVSAGTPPTLPLDRSPRFSKQASETAVTSISPLPPLGGTSTQPPVECSLPARTPSLQAILPETSRRTSRLSDTVAVQDWNRAMEGDGLHMQSSWRIVNFCRGILRARGFEQFIALLIVINSCSVAAQADLKVRYSTQATPAFLLIFETMCTVIFTFELLVRVVAEGRQFVSCRNRHLKWNMLDTLLVTSGLGEELLEHSWDMTVDTSFVRVVRFLRLIRIMRIVRVMRFFQDLRNMVSGILVSIKPLLWAMVLLTMIAFMFAIFILEMVSTEITAATAMNNVDTVTQLQLHFGGIVTTIYSLYKAITGGADWGDQASYLVDITPWLGGAFCVYVAFSVICVMNIVTGIFVENSSKLSMKDESTLIMELMESESKWMDEMSSVYDVMRGDSDEVTKSQFENGMMDFGIQARMKKLGVDADSYAIIGLFDLLDFDRSGSLKFEEFVLGVKMLHGNAKSIDIAKLLYDNIVIKDDLRQIISKLDDCADPRLADRECGTLVA
eukprot:TRINITY_DN23264_c0_g2_i1.p1 TRINITY_DN23264_c0_g2~~TRINITY_DN23264_c0_g2_i1.p1  ORF type:complete len:598 (+),score=57.58 TRINITY_DN23264_c0_g2_i1:71-1795(+)